MADPRLQSIYFAAGRLFNTKRYANTKVSEIAAAADIATGTVYNLFTSKKAILTFVIRASLEDGYLQGDISLPIPETDQALLTELFEQALQRFYNLLAITNEKGVIQKSFVQMVSDIFDMCADSLLATNNIEHNQDILWGLAKVFFPARDRFFQLIEQNIKLYMNSGEIRQLEYPQVHLQSIVDVLTWWAMNAYIAMPDVSIPRETAKKIAVDLLAHAYLKQYE
jgi:AcrR family transcriptional regulator